MVLALCVCMMQTAFAATSSATGKVGGYDVEVTLTRSSSKVTGKTEFTNGYPSYCYTTVNVTGQSTNGNGSYKTVTGSSSGSSYCSKSIYPSNGYYFYNSSSYHTAGTSSDSWNCGLSA